MSVRPFLLVGASTLSTLKDLLKAAVLQWKIDWELDDIDVSIDCFRAWEVAKSTQISQSNIYFSEYDKRLWCHWSQDLQKLICRKLFTPDQAHLVSAAVKPTLATDVANEALTAMSEYLANALMRRSPSQKIAGIPTDSYSNSSGFVQVHIRIGSEQLIFLLSHEIVTSFSAKPTSTPLPINRVSLMKLLEAVDVSLSVKLGQAEVSIDNFVTLTVGDVVRLDSLVEHPISVVTNDSQPMFDGFLGKSGDNIAIELVRRT